MSIKAGAKDRLRIAGLFLYLTAKYGAFVLFMVVIYHDMYPRKGCTEDCFLILVPFGMWGMLGIVEWILYSKIIWKYEINSKQ